jgi:nucleotide-binding universal stress UspA family protein
MQNQPAVDDEPIVTGPKSALGIGSFGGTMMNIRKIVCPVDFFPASTQAARYAVAMAKRYDAKLILLHVIEPDGASVYGLSADNVWTGIIRKKAAERLEEVAKLARTQNVSVEVLLRAGLADMVIHSAIGESHADLVVMGTHGRRGLKRFLMGSTTERLLRILRVPVLTIRASRIQAAKPVIRHVLLATDLAEGTTEAADYAVSLAVEHSARLTLLHVLNDVEADVSGVYRDPLIRGIERELEELVPVEARSGCRLTAKVLVGRASRRILPIIKRAKADLVIINIHKKTLLDRLTIGRTAEKIVSESPVPVLAVPSAAVRKRNRRTARRAA